MKILLVDDHAVVRMAVAMLMVREGHDIVGECSNGVEALEKIERLSPDIIILDLDIPLIDGLAVVDRLRKDKNTAQVMVYTGMKSSAYALQCFRSGVAAYVSKHEAPQEVGIALKTVLSGKSYYPSGMWTSVRALDCGGNEASLINQLSKRELRVFQGLVLGYGNKKIAEDMLLSNKTVSTYKMRIMMKLQVSSLMELVDFAKRNNLS
ncbi:Virulence factors putative positive transcription regulator BvgA [Pseudomonas fluorescens]|uniref:response regulator transcription factor n=1 Tax=Pseudomonas fluorescens TaxID=294 RepID=UPI00123FB24E|nr:response regulator transcription factor [Pseudomonas fluorescens]VVP32139.1 Virulence factors putative positive transcription regulator BvgA [Pseudomonas fluorescens]